MTEKEKGQIVNGLRDVVLKASRLANWNGLSDVVRGRLLLGPGTKVDSLWIGDLEPLDLLRVESGGSFYIVEITNPKFREGFIVKGSLKHSSCFGECILGGLFALRDDWFFVDPGGNVSKLQDLAEIEVLESRAKRIPDF